MASYTVTTNIFKLTVGNISNSIPCHVTRIDRNVAETFIGRTPWVNEAYLNGNIAGLYAVDALLTEEEIEVVIRRINAGEDTLQACAACPVNTFKAGTRNALSACQACPAGSVRGAVRVGNCTCNAGFAGVDNNSIIY